MSVVKRIRLKGTRQVGLALSGLLVAGLAVASGTALASSGSVSSATAMSGMAQTMSASTHAKAGFTNGWYDGHTVRFFYSKNFCCKQPPASNASSKCEGGSRLHPDPGRELRPAVRGSAARVHPAEVDPAVPDGGQLHRPSAHHRPVGGARQRRRRT